MSLWSVCMPSSVDSQEYHLFDNQSTGTREESTAIEVTEGLLTEQMTRLSFQEKKQADEDLHCLPDEIEESIEMIDTCLEEFEIEVQAQRNFVYDIAERQNKEFVEDRDFRLMFLRADMFNARSATKRLMKFLQQKLTYFGEEKLTKEIEWSDLTEGDIEVLESGRWHVQADNDRSGRPILFILNHVEPNFKPENFVRASYFRFFQYILPNINSQRRGVVGIYYDTLGKVQQTALNVATKTWLFNLTVPIRYTAMHVCLKMNKTPWYLNHVLTMLPRDVVVRTKIHHGSDMEIQYDLRRYGIQLESFPVSMTGEVRHDIVNKWLESCKDHPRNNSNNNNNHHHHSDDLSSLSRTFSPGNDSEATTATTTAATIIINSTRKTVHASPKDVLLGRGRTHKANPGNIELHKLVEDRLLEYYKGNKAKRRQLASEISQCFNSSGGRFLKLSDAINLRWVEIDSIESTKTIMQLFRSIRKSKLKKTTISTAATAATTTNLKD